MCQKMRGSGLRGLPEVTLTLKNGEYRRSVGIDHLKITPADKRGNSVVLLVVEHYAHFPQA